MPVALCALSHSPLMGRNDPSQEVVDEVDAELDRARRFVADFDPEVIVVFAPDHYNSFFYDLLPPFCVGRAATSVGDYGTEAGPLDVDRELAHQIAVGLLASGIDTAVSERMRVDHGFAQPLEFLVGSIAAVPTVPIFINSVATPLGPVQRIRLLGEAVGRVIAEQDKRVLLLGSGGLSHDPPVPQFDTAPPPVRETLIDGRDITAEQRVVREDRVITAGGDFAAGKAHIQPLNPLWDNEFLDLMASGDLTAIDSWSVSDFVESAGHSSHEVRTWIAAYAALAVSGAYRMTSRYYRAIPEWIAGFAVTTAAPTHS